jgi:hypothetical protein
MALVVGAGVLLLALPVRRAFAALDEPRRRTASWLLLGSFFSMAPVLSVAPSPRVIGIPALGIAATVAIVLESAWFPDESRDPKLERRGVAGLTGLVALLLGFFHLVHAPVTSWLLAQQMRTKAVEFAEHSRWLRTRIADAPNASVVIVRGLGGMFFAPFGLEPDARPPERWRILSQTGHVLVLRVDERTIDLISGQTHTLTSTGPTNLFRPPGEPLHVGDEFFLAGVHVTVLDANDEGPRRVRYVFDRDLDDMNVQWIAEGVSGFYDAPPPKIGFGKPLEP